MIVSNKWKQLVYRFDELEYALSQPENMADSGKYAALLKEYNGLEPIVLRIRQYEEMYERLCDTERLSQLEDDPEFRALAREEYCLLRDELAVVENEIKKMLIPRDPDDDKNVIVEIRAGTGGEEAALFAGVLFRMYTMYAEKHGFRCEIGERNETELGGYKVISMLISGQNVYAHFKFESGVHRVQRVPETESSGRIHTSAASVAVLPEVEDVQIEINDSDLQIDTIKSSGAGGQHINKTESAIRLIHKPSGLVIECQDERSQLRNKEKALRLLRSRLYDLKRQEQTDRIASARKTQIGSGDRSERIRTYNFPQGRITDHRVGVTLYTLDSFVNGNMDAVIEALTEADILQRMKDGNEML